MRFCDKREFFDGNEDFRFALFRFVVVYLEIFPNAERQKILL